MHALMHVQESPREEQVQVIVCVVELLCCVIHAHDVHVRAKYSVCWWRDRYLISKVVVTVVEVLAVFVLLHDELHVGLSINPVRLSNSDRLSVVAVCF